MATHPVHAPQLWQVQEGHSAVSAGNGTLKIGASAELSDSEQTTKTAKTKKPRGPETIIN